MSQENVQLARGIVRAWDEGGFDALLPFCPQDAVWHPFPEWPDGAEPRIGHEGIHELLEAWDDSFDEWTVFEREVRDLGDRVLVFGEMVGRIKGSGVPIHQPVGLLFSDFRNGQIGEAHFFLTQKQAVDAARLPG